MYIPSLAAPPVRALLVVWVLAFVVAGYAWTRVSPSKHTFHGTEYPDSPLAPDFALIDHRGEAATLSAQRGRAVLLFFGYSRCPDVCPLTLSRLSRVLRDAGIGPDRLRVLLVTVDPEFDAPQILAQYIEPFGPSFEAITGTRQQIDAVLAEYGVFAEAGHGHDGSSTLAHTSVVFAVDSTGRLRALIHPEEAAEIVTADIQTLLRLGN
jgi:protein SCO1